MSPLVLISVAWIAGLVAAHHWLVPAGLQPASVTLLGLIPLAGLLLWPRDKQIRLASLCAGALVLGALRYQGSVPDLGDVRFVAHYNDRGWVRAEGIVEDYPDVRDAWTYLVLAVEQITVDGQTHPVRGRMLVRAARYPAHRYGDRLLVSGQLVTPPEWEGFSYRRHLARQGIYSYLDWPRVVHLASGEGNPLWAALYSVKDNAHDLIARLMPDPEASVLQGILLGIESGIPKDLSDDYHATGTSHIIAISGANITILAGLLSVSLGRLLGKRKAFWLSLGGIVTYVLLVGADPVVVRAGTMGCLLLLAGYLGRQATAYVSLLAAAAFLTLLNPFTLWDVGFQLSFASTLGLVFLAPPLEGLLERLLGHIMSREWARQVIHALSDVLILTLAAQIMTAPLVAYHFGRVSLVAPLANLLILPAQPGIMILGGATTLAGLIPPLESIAQVMCWVPWLLLAYTHTIIRWLADWPVASASAGSTSQLWVWLTYLMALVAAGRIARAKGLSHRSGRGKPGQPRERWLAGGLAITAVLVWLAALQMPDGRLHVAFLDVGQGDAILITTPRGRQILVDGGPTPSALTQALGREMAFWDRSLDLVVATHPDLDHVAGLPEVLRRYDVAAWWDDGTDPEGSIYRECLALVAGRDVDRQSVGSGSSLDLGDGLSMVVLHPPLDSGTSPTGDNNASIVIRLDWGRASFLLTGDIEAEAEHDILDSGVALAAQVLKVAHHGSEGSSTQEFLDAVAPRWAVISVGADNRVGHPDGQVLERLSQRREVNVLRTDQDGTIEFITDGEQIQVRTSR